MQMGMQNVCRFHQHVNLTGVAQSRHGCFLPDDPLAGNDAFCDVSICLPARATLAASMTTACLDPNRR
jgi:hypothetical protein